jgi:hypothetical protein
VEVRSVIYLLTWMVVVIIYHDSRRDFMCIRDFVLELPWDEPTSRCQEYLDWKDCKITLSPWCKIDNLALCKFLYAHIIFGLVHSLIIFPNTENDFKWIELRLSNWEIFFFLSEHTCFSSCCVSWCKSQMANSTSISLLLEISNLVGLEFLSQDPFLKIRPGYQKDLYIISSIILLHLAKQLSS